MNRDGRPEMPIVLRSGTAHGIPTLVPAQIEASVPRFAHLPAVVGRLGWVLATLGCAVSVFAVRDTMLTPLGHTDAPSAWEVPSHSTHPASSSTASVTTPSVVDGPPAPTADASPTPTGTTTPTSSRNASTPASGSATVPDSMITTTVVGSSAHPSTSVDAIASSTTDTAPDPSVSSAPSVATPSSQDGNSGHGGGSGSGSGSGGHTP